MNEIINLPMEATTRSIDYVVTVTNQEFADKIHKKILKNNPGVRIMKLPDLKLLQGVGEE